MFLPEFSEKAKRAMELAGVLAKFLKHQKIFPIHLLYGIIGEGSGSGFRALDSLGVKGNDMRESIQSFLPTGLKKGFSPEPSLCLLEVIFVSARSKAQEMGGDVIHTGHLLLSVIECREEELSARVLSGLGIDLDELSQKVIEFLG